MCTHTRSPPGITTRTPSPARGHKPGLRGSDAAWPLRTAGPGAWVWVSAPIPTSTGPPCVQPHPQREDADWAQGAPKLRGSGLATGPGEENAPQGGAGIRGAGCCSQKGPLLPSPPPPCNLSHVGGCWSGRRPASEAQVSSFPSWGGRGGSGVGAGQREQTGPSVHPAQGEGRLAVRSCCHLGREGIPPALSPALWRAPPPEGAPGAGGLHPESEGRVGRALSLWGVVQAPRPAMKAPGAGGADGEPGSQLSSCTPRGREGGWAVRSVSISPSCLFPPAWVWALNLHPRPGCSPGGKRWGERAQWQPWGHEGLRGSWQEPLARPDLSMQGPSRRGQGVNLTSCLAAFPAAEGTPAPREQMSPLSPAPTAGQSARVWGRRPCSPDLLPSPGRQEPQHQPYRSTGPQAPDTTSRVGPPKAPAEGQDNVQVRMAAGSTSEDKALPGTL